MEIPTIEITRDPAWRVGGKHRSLGISEMTDRRDGVASVDRGVPGPQFKDSRPAWLRLEGAPRCNLLSVGERHELRQGDRAGMHSPVGDKCWCSLYLQAVR